MSMYLNFKAVRPLDVDFASWTASDFVDWAASYLEAIQPFWQPEYLVDTRDYQRGQVKIRTMPDPEDCSDAGFRNPVCYVHQGRSEGYLLQVGYKDRGGKYHELAFAKYLGDPECAWEGARALSEALDSIYGYGEMPMLVDLLKAMKVEAYRPVSFGFKRTADRRPAAQVEQAGDKVFVRCQHSRRLVAEFDLVPGPARDLRAEAIMSDLAGILERHDLEVRHPVSVAA